MIKNIILAGVGGQGILTIASIIDLAAMHSGLNVKQAEVHGMSQRGGDVQSNLRISDEEIYSDLIPKGKADIILAMEPLEALRYVSYLQKDGIIITASAPFKNIPNYPDENQVLDTIKNSGFKHIIIDSNEIAQNLSERVLNVVIAGAVAPIIGIDSNVMKESVKELFAAKGEEIVAMNVKAFETGVEYNKKL
ncbi:MAG: indolepyruvate oxidoreductase subunit beta [Bacteroidales bacterium]|jgi:indolepyruvate ferredoxin oxidoreductase beta subunit|nr:indolepyruvate oxidoreductase subunit beta [Bacteroidales bacterium]MBP5725294.1 indolepyruvate oxidoreductase subunit beta [Bacteroidales bacterium]MBQ3676059.1 indolepyruvate oxidoreductase subunit beta [Bacteroidales bacterium]MBR3980233.1 indolepyruvate oxidoreductase subunit beta [Bacteroidales bacterium]MBR4115830.1 indolepyruvate oxidoreductase subunit beta [Bacteroidales bacterium]